MKFGAQLYNFREAMAKDYEGTLKRIAALGFDGVEVLNYTGPMSPKEYADFLASLNLECAGYMHNPDVLLDADGVCYEYAKALNAPAVSISWSSQYDYINKWRDIPEVLKKIGLAAKKNGLQFAYHNHWYDSFPIDGESLLHKLLNANAPDLVFAEPDICWLNRAGLEPAAFIRRYAKRIRQIHFKDILVADDRSTTAPLGTGCIDLKAAYTAALESDAQWIIYEQDFSSDPFADAEKSITFLKKLEMGLPR